MAHFAALLADRTARRIFVTVLLAAFGAAALVLVAPPGYVPLALLLVAAGALVVGFALASATRGAIHEVTLAAQRMAAGDLAQRIRDDSPDEDEIGALARALDQLAGRMNLMVGDASQGRNALSAVLANMDDGILIVEADGAVTLANPAAERILQVPEGQATSRSFVEVLRDHELVQLVRDCTAGRVATGVRLTEAGLLRRFLRIQVATLGDGRCLVVLQDLTEIRRAETIRRDFVANVSHELRTPLASLKALVETLQDGALEDPPAARGFLERMNVEVDGLTQLVRELLELSRIESGQTAMRFETVDVEGVLAQAVERLRAQADRGGLALAVEVAPDLPRVTLDPDRIQQALINLLHNAIKFTPPGGQIRVLGQGARGRLDGTFELLPQEAAGPVPTHVVLSVVDTGVGIPAADQPRIFERFYKAEKARSGGGTGLGLAIVKHVAEAHGGRVWVESVEGKGATFRIALPVGRKVDAHPRQATHRSAE